jgi:hypothetical protein
LSGASYTGDVETTGMTVFSSPFDIGRRQQSW